MNPGPRHPGRLEAQEGLLELFRHTRRDRQAVRLEEALLKSFGIYCLMARTIHGGT